MSQRDIIELLLATDVYVTPYLDPNQITSGTLSYALGAGKAVVSTRYMHAAEALEDGRGVLVEFRDPGGLARAVTAILGDPAGKAALETAAFAYARGSTWPQVGARPSRHHELADPAHRDAPPSQPGAPSLARHRVPAPGEPDPHRGGRPSLQPWPRGGLGLQCRRRPDRWRGGPPAPGRRAASRRLEPARGRAHPRPERSRTEGCSRSAPASRPTRSSASRSSTPSTPTGTRNRGLPSPQHSGPGPHRSPRHPLSQSHRRLHRGGGRRQRLPHADVAPAGGAEPRRHPLRGRRHTPVIPANRLRGVRLRGSPRHPHRRRSGTSPTSRSAGLGISTSRLTTTDFRTIRPPRPDVPPRPEGRRPLPGACPRSLRRPHPSDAPVLRPRPRHLDRLLRRPGPLG